MYSGHLGTDGLLYTAESCMLSPVDIIFTRIGASDRIMSEQSTFMVECNEAFSVLRYAAPDPLVILDELGRGTFTFDNYVIAYSVLRHLVDSVLVSLCNTLSSSYPGVCCSSTCDP
ncbi:hypothetical protein KP509_03G024400 [Ceratopteris richardii]|uniref:DNA mismatch repair proteins mutS family domain-containing protein n=1 Tax=Ceratopteris richardii TaxID=49495 RepID=A0A8T2V0Y2_CERRI|nr:hypothetical protein KP509_03G024400 [Ceratopteris richardii]